MTDPMKTIFRKGTQPSDTDWWVVWHKYLDVARTPVIEDEHDRMYWSGAELDFPRYAPWAKIFSEWGKGDGRGGTLYCDGPSWRLGVPPPATAPTLSGGEQVPLETVDRQYVFTFFSPSGGESCASDPVSVTVPVGLSVKIEEPSVATTPPGNTTDIYVYRRDDPTHEYKFVGKMPLLSESFTDNVDPEDLGASINPALLACAIASYDPPRVAAVAPIVGKGPTTKHYYTYALYQKISVYDENTEQNYGPGLHGFYVHGGMAPPSLETDASQTVTLTLPRSGGTYLYNGGWFDGDLPKSFPTVPDTTNWEFVILRSTTWSPNNMSNYQGWEIVGTTTPKLAGDTSAHTFTIPARNTVTTYIPPVTVYPILYPYSFSNSTYPSLATGASSGGSLDGVPGRLYTFTYVIGGVETNRSLDSTVVRAADGADVFVEISYPAPAGPPDPDINPTPVGATAIKIYRRDLPPPSDPTYNDALAQSSEYRLVTTLTPPTVSYNDTTLKASLGDKIALSLLPTGGAKPDVTAVVLTPEEDPDQISESRLYVYTYVTAYGEEGPPSPVSEMIEVFPNSSVLLQNLLMNPNPTWYNMQSKRIYRSSTGTNLTTLQFVAEIPVDQMTYTDTLPGSELGEVISSTYYFPPPETCTGMRLMANGIMVMFDGKTLYPSEAYLPHAYDPNNYLTTEHEIVGLEVFGQSLAVLTTGYPYVLTGTDPSALSLTRLPVPQACSSKRSGVSTGDGALYASPDGMMLISPGGVRNLTEMILNRDQWQAYNPFTMHSYVYNNYVFVFHDTGCIMFNFSGAAAIMAEIDELAIAGFYDAVQDALFYSKPDGIYKWDAGDLVPYTWRSKIFQITRPHNFGWGQVEADTYPLMFRVYNGLSTDPLYSYEVQGREPFRLPAGSIHRDWYVQLEGTATVFQVQIADDQAELKEV